MSVVFNYSDCHGIHTPFIYTLNLDSLIFYSTTHVKPKLYAKSFTKIALLVKINFVSCFSSIT